MSQKQFGKQQLLKKKQELMQQIYDKQQEILNKQQQTQLLYTESQDLQDQLFIKAQAEKIIDAQSVQNVNQLQQENQRVMIQLNTQNSLLQQENQDLNLILQQVNKLKGKQRSIIIIDENSQNLIQFDNTRLIKPTNTLQQEVVEASQIFISSQTENQQLLPNSSSLLKLIGSQKNKQKVFDYLIKELFQNNIQKSNFIQLSGITLFNNCDIFDQTNDLTIFDQYNNLIKIPIRTFEHFYQVFDQLQIKEQFMLVIEVYDENFLKEDYIICDVQDIQQINVQLIVQFHLNYEIFFCCCQFDNEEVKQQSLLYLEMIENEKIIQQVGMEDMHAE